MLNNSPYFRKPASVRSVMLRVLVALLPGLAAYVWFFGAAILVQIALASVAALAGEAAILSLRERFSCYTLFNRRIRLEVIACSGYRLLANTSTLRSSGNFATPGASHNGNRHSQVVQ